MSGILSLLTKPVIVRNCFALSLFCGLLMLLGCANSQVEQPDLSKEGDTHKNGNDSERPRDNIPLTNLNDKSNRELGSLPYECWGPEFRLLVIVRLRLVDTHSLAVNDEEYIYHGGDSADYVYWALDRGAALKAEISSSSKSIAEQVFRRWSELSSSNNAKKVIKVLGTYDVTEINEGDKENDRQGASELPSAGTVIENAAGGSLYMAGQLAVFGPVGAAVGAFMGAFAGIGASFNKEEDDSHWHCETADLELRQRGTLIIKNVLEHSTLKESLVEELSRIPSRGTRPQVSSSEITVEERIENYRELAKGGIKTIYEVAIVGLGLFKD